MSCCVFRRYWVKISAKRLAVIFGVELGKLVGYIGAVWDSDPGMGKRRQCPRLPSENNKLRKDKPQKSQWQRKDED
jgi:hypothetical protein